MTKRQNILITGASSGIGEALATHYLESGATVGVCGRDRERTEALCNENEAAHPLVFDTIDADAAGAMIAGFSRKVGGIDLAILNAGTHEATDAAAFDAATYARIMNVNYIGTLNCLDPVMKSMRARGAGTIALMGSVAGYVGLPNAGAYCASKSAIMRLAETMRAELKAYGIDVRLISPGFVKTPLTDKNDFPMPFLMDVDAAVGRIVRGLAGRRYEIAFPRRLAWGLRMLSATPSGLYFRIAHRMLPSSRPTGA